MNSPSKPILWHQGLFLQPHHFQQNDAFVKSLLTPHNLCHSPFFWGCSRFVIQEAALSQRSIEIETCELIFQDGTWVKYPGNALVQPRSFEDLSFDVEGDTPVTVYLGIKKWNDFDKNATSIDSNDGINSVGTRYLSFVEPERIKDLHEGGDPASVRKMDTVIRIFWDHETDNFKDYLMIPVCRLELKEEKIDLSKAYITPTYLISGSDMLMKILKNLRENIISRSRIFESYKFSQGLTSDFDAHFLPHLLVLSTLNRALPVLNHIIELKTFHPHSAYGVLRRIVGDLSTFTDRINALGQLKDGTPLLPEYDHENLYHCFNEAQILIGELLRGISIGGESIYSMIREDNYFRVQLPAEEFRDSYLYFIVLKSASETDLIINDMQKIVKIGNSKNIDNMISRALPGLPVKHRLVPPPGMPKHAGSYYFRIDSKHHLWEEIKRSGDISLFWDNAPEDTSIEIVISQV